MHPGDIVAGKYRVAKVLGRSRGVLLEANHTEFDQRVVIRMLSPALCDAKEVERFRREARTLSKLESEHVARIIDVGTHSDGSFFLVRQYLDGQDLANRIQQRGALSLDEAILYTLQVCEAVQECHSHSIILRELQPSHLFLTTKRGGSPVIKIIDFGTAKVMKDPATQMPVDGEMTATVMFGMSPYSSPELIRKLGEIDARTDVWSMGCVLYEMLSAVCPFQGEMAELMLRITRDDPMPLSQLRPDVPRDLDQVIGWALAKDPGTRFNSMYALAHALKPFANPEGQVLIDQIGRLAHTQEPAKAERAISPTSPLAKRPSSMRPPPPPGGATGGRLADLESTVLYDSHSSMDEHDFERTAFLGGSQPPPAYPSSPGSVPPPGYPSSAGSIPPPAYPSSPGSVPPGAYPSSPGSVHPPPVRPSNSGYGSVHPPAMTAAKATGTGNFSALPDSGTGGYPSSAELPPRPAGRQRKVAVLAIGGSLILLPILVFVLIFALRGDGGETALAQKDTAGSSASAASPAGDSGDETDAAGDTSVDTGAAVAGAGGSDGDSGDTAEPAPDEAASAEVVAVAPPPRTSRAVVDPWKKSPPPPPPPPKKKSAPPPPPPKKKAPPPPPKKTSGGKGTLVAIAIGGSCRFAVDGASKGTKSSIRMKISTGAHTVSCTHKGATRTQRVKVGSSRPGIASFKLN